MIWPKSLCIIWVTFILVHEVSCRYSLKEICSQRCLYGRGGILCHCNAMHFTGKRSGSDHNSIDSSLRSNINVRGTGSRGAGDHLHNLKTVLMDSDLSVDDDDDDGDAEYDFLLKNARVTHGYQSKSGHGDDKIGRNDPLKLLNEICAYGCRNGKDSTLCHCSELYSTKQQSEYDHNSIGLRVSPRINARTGSRFRQRTDRAANVLSQTYRMMDDDHDEDDDDDVDALMLEYSVNNKLQHQNQKQQNQKDNSVSSAPSLSSSFLSSPSSSLPFTSISSSLTPSLSLSKNRRSGSDVLSDLPQDVHTRLMAGNLDVGGDDEGYDVMSQNTPYLYIPGIHGGSRQSGKGSWLNEYWLREICASLCLNGVGGYACECDDPKVRQGNRNYQESQYGRYDGENSMVQESFIDETGLDEDEGVSMNSDATGDGDGGNNVVKNKMVLPKRFRSKSESKDIHEIMGDMINRLSTLQRSEALHRSGAHRRHQRHAIREFHSHFDVTDNNNNYNGDKIDGEKDGDDGQTGGESQDSKIIPKTHKHHKNYNSNDSNSSNNNNS